MSQTSLSLSCCFSLPSSLHLLSLSLSLYHLRHEELGTTRSVNAKLDLCYPYICTICVCMCVWKTITQRWCIVSLQWFKSVTVFPTVPCKCQACYHTSRNRWCISQVVFSSEHSKGNQWQHLRSYWHTVDAQSASSVLFNNLTNRNCKQTYSSVEGQKYFLDERSHDKCFQYTDTDLTIKQLGITHPLLCDEMPLLVFVVFTFSQPVVANSP